MDQLFIKREWKAYLFTEQINVILMSFIKEPYSQALKSLKVVV